MAALGYEYGCVGLRIWLRWVTNMAALHRVTDMAA